MRRRNSKCLETNLKQSQWLCELLESVKDAGGKESAEEPSSLFALVYTAEVDRKIAQGYVC